MYRQTGFRGHGGGTHLIGQGYRKEQILTEIWDEPNDANIESWLLMAREVKAHDPAALVYANPPEDWEGHPCTLERTVRPMAPFVDVWAPHLNLIDQFPDTLACMKATGKPIWFYRNVGLAYSRNEGPASGWYRTAPWYVLKHGLQGVGVWSASSTYGDPPTLDAAVDAGMPPRAWVTDGSRTLVAWRPDGPGALAAGVVPAAVGDLMGLPLAVTGQSVAVASGPVYVELPKP